MIPNVDGLPFDSVLTPDGDEYMKRYYLPDIGKGKHRRFHHILGSDPQRDMHDHPWDFTTRLVYGRYIEHTPNGSTTYTAPCTITHKAEQLHMLELPYGDVWSYFLHGRLRRHWGFMTDNGWIPYDHYPDVGTVVVGNRHSTSHRRRRTPAW